LYPLARSAIFAPSENKGVLPKLVPQKKKNFFFGVDKFCSQGRAATRRAPGN